MNKTDRIIDTFNLLKKHFDIYKKNNRYIVSLFLQDEIPFKYIETLEERDVLPFMIPYLRKVQADFNKFIDDKIEIITNKDE